MEKECCEEEVQPYRKTDYKPIIIYKASDKLYAMLFADDTNVFLDGHNLNTLVQELHNELKKLYICSTLIN